MSKIGLGTVQFGLEYGVSNQNGQVSLDEVSKILECSKSQGIQMLDTAQGYGVSESVLGKFDLSDFNIVTKIIGTGQLEKSLADLCVSSIYGLLFHREEEINDISWKRYESWKDQGLVKKIGVSVYTPDILLRLIDQYPIDLVQIPLNLFDQRFMDLLELLKQKGIEIHTRSTFLQGLIFLKKFPSGFEKVKKILDVLSNERMSHALKFVLDNNFVDQVILGVTSVDELVEIINSVKQNVEKINYDGFRIDDEMIINPSKWEW